MGFKKGEHGGIALQSEQAQNKMRREMDIRAWTQADWAAATGGTVGQATVSAFIRGEHVRRDKAAALLAALKENKPIPGLADLLWEPKEEAS